MHEDKTLARRDSLTLSAHGDLPQGKSYVLSAPTWEAFDGSLTVRFLQYINAKRAARWHPGGLTEWSALEWAGAMAGEAGEACNAAKKLKRVEDAIANINLEDGRALTDRETASAKIVDEIADTVIYGVLLAERVGLDLEEAIRLKFNRKSEEYGFPERIPPNEPPHAKIGESLGLSEHLLVVPEPPSDLTRLRVDLATCQQQLVQAQKANTLARGGNLASSELGDLPRPTPDGLRALTPERCAQIAEHMHDDLSLGPDSTRTDAAYVDGYEEACADIARTIRTQLQSESRRPDGDGLITEAGDVKTEQGDGRPAIIGAKETIRDVGLPAAGSEPADSHQLATLKAQLAECERERALRLDTDTSVKDRAGMARLPGLEAENAKLKAEVVRLAAHYRATLQAEAALAETLQRLRGAVTPYLTHKSECASHEYMIAPPRGPKPACDCGLAEIQAELMR